MSYVDLHCHLLPGLDDGATSMEETVRHALSRRGFFKGAAAVSFAAAAVTPDPAAAAPARRFTGTVDLTHVMSPEFPKPPRYPSPQKPLSRSSWERQSPYWRLSSTLRARWPHYLRPTRSEKPSSSLP